ncbi:MAG TPA: TraR/DksA C4-type zinc finger protein [Acidimicrobiia bacterium]|jgi:RNA polymerase-binding protein DksA|nr:TraR/DksA C4-type zinc finger protein [Acidimicrobiia bacterium]
MTRQLAESTLKRLRAKLEEERDRLTHVIEEFERQRELTRLAETSSEHAADPDSADGGSLAFEMEMDLSKQQNAQELLDKVNHAFVRMDQGLYGICEVTGKPIPIARLEALPYATTLVEWAHRV